MQIHDRDSHKAISIHALRKESDAALPESCVPEYDFNPRSP